MFPRACMRSRRFYSTKPQISNVEKSIEHGVENMNSNEPKYKPGIFSRNPGWTIGAIVTGIGLYIYRSSRNTKNFEKVQNKIADSAVISPFEAYELRSNNSISPKEFRDVWSDIKRVFPSGKASYRPFDMYLGTKLYNVCPKGIVNGHHLERVLLNLMPNKSEENQEFDLSLLLTAFSLVLKGTSDERLEALYDMINAIEEDASIPSTELLSQEKLEILTQNCLDTYQVPSEKRVVPDATQKYPFEKFRSAHAKDLVDAAIKEKVKSGDISSTDNGFTKEEFISLMKSKSLCIWGECFLPASKKRLKN